MRIRNTISLRYFIPLSVLLFFVFLSPSVFAVGKPNNVGRNITGVQEQRKQRAQNRLTQAKLKACQAKENAIKKRAEHLGKLAANMQDKFDAIAKRVEEYYTTKVVPSGKTVKNYGGLVADIQTKKETVQIALTEAQNNALGFACDSNNPKGQLAQFKDDTLAVKTALKDYRTSIKNLIVAVRSVTGTTERTNPSVSPKPTGSLGQNE